MNNSRLSPVPKNTVYFNSACPVCRNGIEAHRERLGTCDLVWVDISHQPDATKEIATTTDAVRERLHITDAAGRVHIGADALIILWAHTPRLRWLATFIGLPGIRTLVRLVYNWFAAFLFRWNVRHGRW